jgi:hypothetical protein
MKVRIVATRISRPGEERKAQQGDSFYFQITNAKTKYHEKEIINLLAGHAVPRVRVAPNRSAED